LEPWQVEAIQNLERRYEEFKADEERANAELLLHQQRVVAQEEEDIRREEQERAEEEAARAQEIVRQEQAKVAQLTSEAKSSLAQIPIAKIVKPFAGAFVRKKADVVALNSSVDRYLQELTNFADKYYAENQDKPNNGRFSLKRAGLAGNKGSDIRRLYVIAYILEKLVEQLDDRILSRVRKDRIEAVVREFSDVFALETRDFLRYFNKIITENGATKELMRRIGLAQ
jgi:hypothetical protein